jgi:hypothetical protein
MNAPTSLSVAEMSLSSDGEAEISKTVEQKITKSPTQIGADAERIMSSVALKFDRWARRAIFRTSATASIP